MLDLFCKGNPMIQLFGCQATLLFLFLNTKSVWSSHHQSGNHTVVVHKNLSLSSFKSE